MTNDDQADSSASRECGGACSATTAIADTEPAPAFSANDFDPDSRWSMTLDGHCALAARCGRVAQYDDGQGFVYVDSETAT
jgi:hypothetical protein